MVFAGLYHLLTASNDCTGDFIVGWGKGQTGTYDSILSLFGGLKALH